MDNLKKSYIYECKLIGVVERRDIIQQIDELMQQENEGEICLDSLIIRGNDKDNCNNRVTNKQVIALSAAIIKSTSANIKKIDFRYNHIGKIEENEKNEANQFHITAMTSIGNLLQSNDIYSCELQSLNLSGNSIDYIGFQQLYQGLSENATLIELNLNGNPIGNDGGILLAEYLRHNNSLEELEIANTDMGHDSIIAFSTALMKNNTLKKINLENPLPDSKEEEALQHIAKMLQVNKTLTEVVLNKHCITDHGAQVLAERLLENSTLKVLGLRANQISQSGGQALASLLLKGSSITNLDLSANKLGNDGGKAFGAVVELNTTLKELYLGYNNIGDEGLHNIATGLKKNTTLSRLQLWGNHFKTSSSNLFYDLYNSRLKYWVQTDFKPYKVDNVVHIAKQSLEDSLK